MGVFVLVEKEAISVQFYNKKKVVKNQVVCFLYKTTAHKSVK